MCAMRAHQHGLAGQIVERVCADVDGEEARTGGCLVDARKRGREERHRPAVYCAAAAASPLRTRARPVLRWLLSRYIRLSALASSAS